MAKKKRSSSEKSGLSKTDFVKGLPSDTPVADVIAKAKEAGITISKNYVYLIRSKAKSAKAAGGGAKKRGRPRGSKNVATIAAAAAPAKRAGGARTVEVQFANLVAELGLTRSEELLRSVRAKFVAAAS